MFPQKIYAIDISKTNNLQKSCHWLLNHGHTICSFKEHDTFYRFEQTDKHTLKIKGYDNFSIKPHSEGINYIIASKQCIIPPNHSVALMGSYFFCGFCPFLFQMSFLILFQFVLLVLF